MVLTPLRHRDNTWDNAKLDMVEISPGDVTVPLTTVAATFNPFDWFKNAQGREVYTDTSKVMTFDVRCSM